RVAADRITFWARIPLVLLAAALGLFVYRWSREIHGEVGGLVSLALFCLSPNLIAHGRLVTTDVPVALFSLLVAYFLWRNLKAPPGRLWWPYGLSLALAFLAKYSAIVLLPATVGVVLCWLWLDRPSRKDAGSFLRKFGVATALPILAVVVFGFGPTSPFAYVEGFRDAFEKLNTEYLSYLAGEYSREGFYLYYLIAFALKTPIATLMILAISLLAIRRHPRLVLVSLALPALLFFLAPTLRRYNIGIRYVLPIYPFLFVLAGGAISVPSPRGALRWATAVLLIWLAVGTFRAYPHYLPYFNEMAGGSPGGIRWLDDSNIDWGQDLKALGRVAREENLGRIGIIYHGTARPRYYLPDSYVPTRTEAESPRSGQVYAVSAHLALRGGWLDRAQPFRIIGHTIYLYRFP
ncbi:MAG: glycosyltransferase family 39 protein, partial [Planctomycetota bacterium]|nr:glycosyltransferase family 39 protein [Planctomycetota bacterium]